VRNALPALVVVFLLSGCGSNQETPSVLQRFDKMRRELGWMTNASGRVANEAHRLKVAMARANVPAVRTAAVRLNVDARRFSVRAGAAGNRVRALSSDAGSGEVKPYLQQVTLVLSWQWIEGVALSSLANQAWQDPLSIRGGSERRLAADLSWARKAAQRSLQASSAAQAIRNDAKSQFRYTVVTPAV
jgi:hypothetical protein